MKCKYEINMRDKYEINMREKYEKSVREHNVNMRILRDNYERIL